MRVLFIIHDPSRSGAPLAALALMTGLKKNYPEIQSDTLLLSDDENGIKSDFQSISNVYCAWDIWSKWEKRLHRYLRIPLKERKWEKFLSKIHYDLIVSNTVCSLKTSIYLKKRYKIPILLYCHESEVACQCMGITAESLSYCDRFVAVSSFVKEVLTRRKVSKEKISIIHPLSQNMLSFVDPYNKSRDKELTICFAGNYGWTKGGDLISLIISRLHSKYPALSCKFIWLGYSNNDVPFEVSHDLEMLGANIELSFIGKVPDPIKYFKSADIFLLLSREDSFPMVCLENALLGKPCVIFKGATGLEDIFKNEESALFIPYMDIDAVCDAIYKLYTDNDLYNTISRNAHKLANKYYFSHNPIDKIAELILSFS